MSRILAGLMGTGVTLMAFLAGCSSPPPLSIDEYAAWCKGRDERLQERVEERLRDSGVLDGATPHEYFDALWATLIGEYESVVPPIELSALHDVYTAYYQFQSDVESRSFAIETVDTDWRDRMMDIREEQDEWQERWDEEHKSLRKELLTNIPLLDYGKLGEAGCLDLA